MIEVLPGPYVPVRSRQSADGWRCPYLRSRSIDLVAAATSGVSMNTSPRRKSGRPSLSVIVAFLNRYHRRYPQDPHAVAGKQAVALDPRDHRVEFEFVHWCVLPALSLQWPRGHQDRKSVV